MYTACLLPKDFWSHMTASRREVFLLEGTTSKWQYIAVVYVQQSKQQKKNISWVAWKLSFPLREGNCHSACFQHLLTVSRCCLSWATHRLPLSAALLSLAARTALHTGYDPRFPCTWSVSLHTHAEDRQFSLIQKHLTIWINWNNRLLGFFFVVADIV